MTLPIRMINVSKIYRTGFRRRPHPALNGIDLEVQPGEIFGYLGPNGAGKTTTLKLLIGLLHPSHGTVEIFGNPPSDPETRRRVGFMPENPYFYDYLTLTEYLHVVASIYQMPKKTRNSRIDEVIDQVGLGTHARMRIRQLSKGLLQRLGLAQAILPGPELLILDEPMSGLDPTGRWEIREFILAMKSQCTIFFSSHILADAELLCDRVGIINHGRLVHLGKLQDLLLNQVRGFEILFACSGDNIPLPDINLQSQTGKEWKTWCQDEEELNRTLAQLIKTPGIHILSVQPIRRSLEDLFIQTVTQRSSEP